MNDLKYNHIRTIKNCLSAKLTNDHYRDSDII